MFRTFIQYSLPPIAAAGLLSCSRLKSNVAYNIPRNTSTRNTSLKDKVVLITGATSGIGLACAWKFAEEGSKLILVGRREILLKQLKDDISKEFPNSSILTVNISVDDIKSVKELPNKLPNDFKNVDVLGKYDILFNHPNRCISLVNNAGLALGASSVEANNIEDASTVLNTNVLGVIAMCR